MSLWTDRQMDKWTDGWADKRTEGTPYIGVASTSRGEKCPNSVHTCYNDFIKFAIHFCL